MDGTGSGQRGARLLLARHGHRPRTVRWLGTGVDHVVYEVDDDLLVRLATDPHRGDQLAREAQLLHRLAALVPLPIPTPVLADPAGMLVVRKLPGVPLLALPDPLGHAAMAGAALGGLLAVVHAQPPQRWADLVEVDDTPPGAWLTEAQAVYPRLAEHLPPTFQARVEEFLQGPPPAPPAGRVLCHNDLGIEHVLVDPGLGTVTGIIDWSDAAITDPARDLGLILRDLGPAGLNAAVRTYGAGQAAPLLERARFYARCALLEDLAYGLSTRSDAYTAKSLAGCAWVFDDPAADRHGSSAGEGLPA